MGNSSDEQLDISESDTFTDSSYKVGTTQATSGEGKEKVGEIEEASGIEKEKVGEIEEEEEEEDEEDEEEEPKLSVEAQIQIDLHLEQAASYAAQEIYFFDEWVNIRNVLHLSSFEGQKEKFAQALRIEKQVFAATRTSIVAVAMTRREYVVEKLKFKKISEDLTALSKNHDYQSLSSSHDTHVFEFLSKYLIALSRQLEVMEIEFKSEEEATQSQTTQHDGSEAVREERRGDIEIGCPDCDVYAYLNSNIFHLPQLFCFLLAVAFMTLALMKYVELNVFKGTGINILWLVIGSIASVLGVTLPSFLKRKFYEHIYRPKCYILRFLLVVLRVLLLGLTAAGSVKLASRLQGRKYFLPLGANLFGSIFARMAQVGEEDCGYIDMLIAVFVGKVFEENEKSKFRKAFSAAIAWIAIREVGIFMMNEFRGDRLVQASNILDEFRQLLRNLELRLTGKYGLNLQDHFYELELIRKLLDNLILILREI